MPNANVSAKTGQYPASGGRRRPATPTRPRTRRAPARRSPRPCPYPCDAPSCPPRGRRDALRSRSARGEGIVLGSGRNGNPERGARAARQLGSGAAHQRRRGARRWRRRTPPEGPTPEEVQAAIAAAATGRDRLLLRVPFATSEAPISPTVHRLSGRRGPGSTLRTPATLQDNSPPRCSPGGGGAAARLRACSSSCAATASNGSRRRCARLSATAPSLAASRVVANAQAGRGRCAAGHEEGREAVRPGREHGVRLPQHRRGVRRDGHREDGAPGPAVGALQELARAREEPPGDGLGGVAVHAGEVRQRAAPGEGDRLGEELVLAAGEVVVHRPARGVRGGQDVREGGALEAARREQARGGLDHPGSGVCGPSRVRPVSVSARPSRRVRLGGALPRS